MARKQASGGKITMLDVKLYKIEASGGISPITGERLRARERFHGNKSDAERRLAALKAELNLLRELHEVKITEDDLEECGFTVGHFVQAGNTNAATIKQMVVQYREEQARLRAEENRRITFADYFEKYLEDRETNKDARKSTIAKYRSIGTHILDHIGDKHLTELDAETIEDMYTDLRASGLGDETLLTVHSIMNLVMKKAYKHDRIERNPMSKVDRPERTVDVKRDFLQPEEAQRLESIVTSCELSGYTMAVYLALATGSRLGEILGLQWHHVCEDNGRPYINLVQQHTRYNERTDLKTDKHGKRKGRIIPIDASTVAMLESWKARQSHDLNAFGIEQSTTTPIITNTVGTWTAHSDFERWFRMFCVRNGFGAFYTEDGREIVELAVGDETACLYDDDDYVVLWRDSDGWYCDESGKRFSRSYPNPNKGLKKTYRGLRFHWLRHTHFSLRIADGVDAATIQSLGGWRDSRMIDRIYGHTVDDNLWASAGFMDRLRNGEKMAVNKS